MNPRTPSELPPHRMEPLARLPVFLALEGKRAVVAGGSPAAAWKAELLSAAGAEVAVFAHEVCEELRALTAHPPRGPIRVYPRSAAPTDLTGAALAIGAFEDDDAAAAFATHARATGVPVNVVDKPAFCDFAFGSIVNRSPLVIGISTDGAAPVFAQAIRAKIEALIPQGFARWAHAARTWRSAVQSSGLSFAGRRRFWQLFTARAVTQPDRAPSDDDFSSLIAATRTEGAIVDNGSVTLVGAGPGDPELLTLRAVRALQSADVILFDDLVAPAVLDFARREAKRMLVGKTGYGPSCRQDEINALMVSLARSGKRVVRLKGGDPMIFGRASEEIAACRAAGIRIELVPGITAAQGAAGRLGVSLTERGKARRLQYVTGHGEDGHLPKDIDWRSVADPTATTIVYMPARTLRTLAASAIANGLDPATPAIAMARATRPDETIIVSTIAELPQQLADTEPGGPLLVIFGRVLASAVATNAAVLERATG
jgi:uroporphyrin-III C-methyltransferase/precorrin-2 dehydrogenase/sirohydrochlorin ferrochelatase